MALGFHVSTKLTVFGARTLGGYNVIVIVVEEIWINNNPQEEQYGHSPPANIKYPKCFWNPSESMIGKSLLYKEMRLPEGSNPGSFEININCGIWHSVAFAQSPDRSPVRTGPKPGRDPSGWLPPVTFLATCHGMV